MVRYHLFPVGNAHGLKAWTRSCWCEGQVFSVRPASRSWQRCLNARTRYNWTPAVDSSSLLALLRDYRWRHRPDPGVCLSDSRTWSNPYCVPAV